MKGTLFIAAGIMAATPNGGVMKLINIKTGYVVVEFRQGKAEFYDRFLEAELKETGVLIPPALVKEFEGKRAVHLDDPLFEKAFREVYCPLCIANASYQWK